MCLHLDKFDVKSLLFECSYGDFVEKMVKMMTLLMWRSLLHDSEI